MRLDALHGPSTWLIAALPIAVACSEALPRPRLTGQETSALRAAGYPAPPGRVEIVPDRPNGHAVWVDGEWSWMGSAWSWVRGRWIVPPDGATFSPWTTTRTDRGDVLFAPGIWKDRDGHPVVALPTIAFGRTAVGDTTSPSGGDEKTGVLPVTTGNAAADSR